VAAAFVLWGIGQAVRRLAKAPKGRWAVSLGIGLAALVCAGGILNLAHIAYRPVMWIVMVVGVTVAAAEIRRVRLSAARALPPGREARIELALAALAIAAMMVFTIATQLPPREYNFHDDLQKYFAHPVRMIETGTLAGSPLSAIGSETLGGQAFLQGFVVSVLPLRYINALDAVLGLFILLLIAAAAGWRRFGWFPGAFLGVVFVAAINPQYVNISGLYTAAVLMATATMLVADEGEDASPLLLGLVYAALVAIKPIFGMFAAFHIPFSALSGLARDGAQRALAWTGRTVAWSAAALAPWLLTFLPTYLGHGVFQAQTSPVPGDSAGITLLSTDDVFAGDRIASYTAIAGLGLFVAALALIAWQMSARNPGDKANSAPAKPLGLYAAAASGVICYLVLVLYMSRWGGYRPCVRYSVPFLLGTCVIAAIMAPSLLGRLTRVFCVLLPVVGIMAIIASFVPGAIARYQQAARVGSILAFEDASTAADYPAYIQSSLSDATHQRIAKYQADVPPGEPLLAWIDTPYWLDYHRNRIADVDIAGTATPWAHVPPDVHYFFWQFHGYATRRIGDYERGMREPGIGARDRLIFARSYALANLLSQLSNQAQIVASDDEYVLFRIPASGGQR
jgi:hypothetical protein